MPFIVGILTAVLVARRVRRSRVRDYQPLRPNG